MGVATAIGVGAAVGAGMSYFGGQQAAAGAKKASEAAFGQSQAWMNQIQQSKEEALRAYSQYSPAQQAGLDKAMAAQQQDITRQQKLVDSIDPALIEAGKQTKQLLDGQSAPVLKNMQDQRNLQRQTLMDSLRQQLGPGAETSSFAQNQLQKFDSETSNLLSGAQQSYLQQVSGLALNGGASLSQSLGAATSNLAQMANQYGQIGLNKSNIILSAQGQMAGPNQSMVNTAGSAGQAQAMQGQMLGNMGGQLIQGSAMFGGMAMMGGGSPSSPTGNPNSASVAQTATQAQNLNGSSTLSSNFGSYGASPTQYSLMNNVNAPQSYAGGGGSSFGWSADSQAHIGRN